MENIKIEGENLDRVCIGRYDCSKVYVGEDLVWNKEVSRPNRTQSRREYDEMESQDLDDVDVIKPSYMQGIAEESL